MTRGYYPTIKTHTHATAETADHFTGRGFRTRLTRNHGCEGNQFGYGISCIGCSRIRRNYGKGSGSNIGNHFYHIHRPGCIGQRLRWIGRALRHHGWCGWF